MTAARWLTLALALLAGCASSPADEGSRDGGRSFAPSAPLSARDFDAAAQEFAVRVQEAGVRGWPGHVRLDAEGKPFVALGRLTNRTRRSFDLEDFRGPVERALLAHGCAVSTQPDDLGRSVFDEQPAPEAAAEDAVALVVSGSLLEDVEDLGDGARRYDYTIALQLHDVVGGAVVVQTSTKFRSVRSAD